MDDKTLNALSTTLALFQIQFNAFMLLVDRRSQRAQFGIILKPSNIGFLCTLHWVASELAGLRW